MSTPGEQVSSTAGGAAAPATRSTTGRVVGALAAAGSEEMKASGFPPVVHMYASGPGTTNVAGDFAPTQVAMLNTHESNHVVIKEWSKLSEDKQKEGFFVALKANQLKVVEYYFSSPTTDCMAWVDKDGNKALHVAAIYGHEELLKYLVDTALFKVDETNNHGQTSLHLAVWHNQANCVSFLLKCGGSLTVKTAAIFGDFKCELTPIQMAVMRGYTNLMLFFPTELLNSAPHISEIGNLLHLAIFTRQTEALLLLLDLLKVDKTHPLLNTRNGQGYTPLAMAAMIGNVKAIKALYRCGAKVSEVHPEFGTALHVAVKFRAIGSMEEILTLFDKALIKQLNRQRQTPLELAYQLKEEIEAEAKLASNELRDVKQIFDILERYETGSSQQEDKTADYRFNQIHNLVFQGGGLQAIAHVGALIQLQEIFETHHYSFNEIRRVAGSSAGAIIAMMLAVSYTPQEIREELIKKDFNLFAENLDVDRFKRTLQSSNVQSLLKNFLAWRLLVNHNTQASFHKPLKQVNPFPLTFMYETPALCSGVNFLAWVEELILRKTGKRNLTLGELHRLAESNECYKDLFVVATQVAELPKSVIFTSENESMKDILVADVIRASVSIPFIIKKFNIRKKNTDGTLTNENPNYYIAGDLIRSYPVDLFDKQGFQSTKYGSTLKNFPIFNEETLGFNLYSVEQKLPVKFKSVDDLQLTLGQAFYEAEIFLAHLRGNDIFRTVYIDTGDMPFLGFDITVEQKKALIAKGEMAIKTSPLFLKVKQAMIKVASSSQAMLAVTGGGTAPVDPHAYIYKEKTFEALSKRELYIQIFQQELSRELDYLWDVVNAPAHPCNEFTQKLFEWLSKASLSFPRAEAAGSMIVDKINFVVNDIRNNAVRTLISMDKPLDPYRLAILAEIVAREAYGLYEDFIEHRLSGEIELNIIPFAKVGVARCLKYLVSNRQQSAGEDIGSALAVRQFELSEASLITGLIKGNADELIVGWTKQKVHDLGSTTAKNNEIDAEEIYNRYQIELSEHPLRGSLKGLKNSALRTIEIDRVTLGTYVDWYKGQTKTGTETTISIPTLIKYLRTELGYQHAQFVICRADLTGIDLSGVNLSDIDFSGAIISGDISGAKFIRSLLIATQLRVAAANNVDFRQAKLMFMQAQGIDFNGSDFYQADLSFANLAGANLTGCRQLRTVCVWHEAKLTDVRSSEDLLSLQEQKQVAFNQKLLVEKQQLKQFQDWLLLQQAQSAELQSKLQKEISKTENSREELYLLSAQLTALRAAQNDRFVFEIYCKQNLSALKTQLDHIETVSTAYERELTLPEQLQNNPVAALEQIINSQLESLCEQANQQLEASTYLAKTNAAMRDKLKAVVEEARQQQEFSNAFRTQWQKQQGELVASAEQSELQRLMSIIEKSLEKGLDKAEGEVKKESDKTVRVELRLPTVDPRRTVIEKIQKLRQRILGSFYLETVLHYYLEPIGQNVSNDELFPLYPWVKGEFLANPTHQVLLLQGKAGSGKSTFFQFLLYSLWQDPAWEEWTPENSPKIYLPIFIPLGSTSIKPHQLFKYLKQLPELIINLEDSEIEVLKRDYRLLFLCDGYDERPEQTPLNLWDSNQFDEEPGHLKLLISCSTTHLEHLDINATFVPHEHDGKPRLENFVRQQIALFDKHQLPHYIERYLNNKKKSREEIPLKNMDTYQQAFIRFPILQTLVTSPFMLFMTLEAMPKIITKLTLEVGKEQVPLTRTEIYDFYMSHWFEREAYKRALEERVEPIDIVERLIDEFRQFCLEFAKHLQRAKITAVQYPYRYSEDLFAMPDSLSIDPDGAQGTWVEELFGEGNSSMKRARYGAPLLAAPDNYWQFIHVSFIDYFYAMAIVKSIKLLNESILSNGQVLFLADRMKNDRFFKAELLAIFSRFKKLFVRESILQQPIHYLDTATKNAFEILKTAYPEEFIDLERQVMQSTLAGTDIEALIKNLNVPHLLLRQVAKEKLVLFGKFNSSKVKKHSYIGNHSSEDPELKVEAIEELLNRKPSQEEVEELLDSLLNLTVAVVPAVRRRVMELLFANFSKEEISLEKIKDRLIANLMEELVTADELTIVRQEAIENLSRLLDDKLIELNEVEVQTMSAVLLLNLKSENDDVRQRANELAMAWLARNQIQIDSLIAFYVENLTHRSELARQEAAEYLIRLRGIRHKANAEVFSTLENNLTSPNNAIALRALISLQPLSAYKQKVIECLLKLVTKGNANANHKAALDIFEIRVFFPFEFYIDLLSLPFEVAIKQLAFDALARLKVSDSRVFEKIVLEISRDKESSLFDAGVKAIASIIDNNSPAAKLFVTLLAKQEEDLKSKLVKELLIVIKSSEIAAIIRAFSHELSETSAAESKGEQGVIDFEAKGYVELDVPPDGSCLFYSLALSFLLPILNDIDAFAIRYYRLFGKEGLAIDAPERLRQLLATYDGQVAFIEEHLVELEVLIDTRFRTRLVNYMRSREALFSEVQYQEEKSFESGMSRMARAKTWGGHRELEAASQYLERHILVYEKVQGQLVERARYNSERYRGKPLYLVRTSTKPGSTILNHYHYLLLPEQLPLNIESRAAPAAGRDIDRRSFTTSAAVTLPAGVARFARSLGVFAPGASVAAASSNTRLLTEKPRHSFT